MQDQEKKTITIDQIKEWLIARVPEPQLVDVRKQNGCDIVVIGHRAVAGWRGEVAATLRLTLMGSINDEGNAVLGAAWIVSQATIDCSTISTDNLENPSTIASFRESLMTGLAKVSMLVNTMIHGIMTQLDPTILPSAGMVEKPLTPPKEDQ